MSDHYGHNVWEGLLDDRVGGVRRRVQRRKDGHKLGATVWELDPGSQGIGYHFHHGTEELLIVLRGSPTLRAIDGEFQLHEGEVVHFPPGVEGSHRVSNPTNEIVRYVVVAANVSPDIVEYPDEGTFIAVAKTNSQYGQPFRVDDKLDDPGYERGFAE